MSCKSFSSLLVNSFCCQVPARCSSWGGWKAGENKQKLSPRPEVGAIRQHSLLADELCRPRWDAVCHSCVKSEESCGKHSPASVGHFSPVADSSVEFKKKKKSRGVAETGKLQPTSQDEWTACTLGGRPTDSLWGQSSLLTVSWHSPSKLLWRLVCTAPGPGYFMHSDEWGSTVTQT